MTTTLKQSTLAAVWQSLDAICVGTEPIERNLLTLAQESIQAVIDALMTPGQIDSNNLAARLESAVNRLRLAGGHLDDVVLTLSESSTV